MKVPKESQGIGTSVWPILEKLPFVSRYAKTRGWYYVISWLHRMTGISLAVVLIAYLYALWSWQVSDLYHPAIRLSTSPFMVLIVWIFSLFVGFHAFNGGRLILYELFGRRGDDTMVRWVLGLSAAYAAMVGLLMVVKNQTVSAFFFWLMTFFAGAVTAFVVDSRTAKNRHSLFWKLQRISGSFLLVTVPAYLLFSYLNPALADESRTVVVRLQNAFVRVVTLALAISALYHAGYGLYSVAAGYVSSRPLRTAITALIGVCIAVLAALAFRLILSV